MELSSYKITQIDQVNKNITVNFVFSDAALNSTQTISCAGVAFDSVDDEGKPILEVKPRFSLDDAEALDLEIKEYAAAFLAGVESTRIIIAPEVDALIGKVREV